jgi:hypothetical protein
MAIKYHDISASRSENGEVVERVEFIDGDSAWWYGTYQGGRIKTTAQVRVRLGVTEDEGVFFSHPKSQWASVPLSAVEFKHGDRWIDRHALRNSLYRKGKQAEGGAEHRAIIDLATAFTDAVLEADPHILHRAQISWHRERKADYDRKAESADGAMRAAIESSEKHAAAIAELEAGYTKGTIE